VSSRDHGIAELLIAQGLWVMPAQSWRKLDVMQKVAPKSLTRMIVIST
jgi:hypothetical protein